MKKFLVVMVSILALAAGSLVMTSAADAGPNPYQQNIRSTGDWFTFSASMGTFQYYDYNLGHQYWPYLMWRDDQCSAPLGAGDGYDGMMGNSCERHDFCYRNNSWAMADRHWMKASCDNNFYDDMEDKCNSYAFYDWKASWCHATKGVYITAVEWGGSIDNYPAGYITPWCNWWICNADT